MDIRSKLMRLLGKNARFVPWVFMSMVTAMLVIAIMASLVPLSIYAIRRESNQVEAASRGFTNFLNRVLAHIETQSYSTSQDRDLQLIIHSAVDSDKLRTLRRKLVDLASNTNSDLVLFTKANGMVMAAYPEMDSEGRSREGKSLARWPMISRAVKNEAHVVSLTTLSQRIYAAGSIPVFYNGNRLGTLVLASELNTKLIKQWATDLSAELMLTGLNNRKIASSLRNAKDELVFFDAKAVRKNRIVEGGISYAVDLQKLETKWGSTVGQLVVAKSLDSFMSELNQVLLSILLWVTPFFGLCIAAVFFFSDSLKSLTLNIQKTSRKLAATVKTLSISQKSLERRIRDSNTVLHIAQSFVGIASPQDLAKVIQKESKSLLDDLTLEARLDLGEARDLQTVEVLAQDSTEHGVRWSKQFVTDNNPDKSFGELRLVGNRPLSDREKLLMETLFTTAKLSVDNLIFLHTIVDKSRTESEVRLAQDVQAAIMPQSFPSGHGFAVAGFFEPATILGGDWQGCFYDEASGCIRAYIGDVTGHGVPSALISSAVMAYVHSIENREREAAFNLLKTMEELDEIVRKVGKGVYLMSFLIIEIDVQSGEGRYVKAAHTHPLIISPPSPSDQKRPPMRLLTGGGSFLGLSHAENMTNTPKFEERPFTLHPGEAVVLYTDGCIEVTNSEDRPFGLKRLNRLFVEHLDKPVEEMLAAFRHAIESFTDQAFADDLTIMVIKTDENFAIEPPVPIRKSTSKVSKFDRAG